MYPLFQKLALPIMIILAGVLVLEVAGVAWWEARNATVLEVAQSVVPATSTSPSSVYAPATSSVAQIPDLPDRFSAAKKRYSSDQFGFSFLYPSDVTIVATSSDTTFLGRRGFDQAMYLEFEYKDQPFRLIKIAQTTAGVPKSDWVYDPIKAKYTFISSWLNLPCPQPFFGNAALPAAATVFGEGGDLWRNYYMLLDSRVLMVETYDSDVELGYSRASPVDRAKAKRNKEIGDELERQILQSFLITKGKAQSFLCMSREAYDHTAPPGMKIQVLAPTGGERLEIGAIYDIRWTNYSGNDPVTIALQTIAPNGKTSARIITSDAPGAAGSYKWKVSPENTGSTFRIEVYPGGGRELVGYSRSFRIVEAR